MDAFFSSSLSLSPSSLSLSSSIRSSSVWDKTFVSREYSSSPTLESRLFIRSVSESVMFVDRESFSPRTLEPSFSFLSDFPGSGVGVSLSRMLSFLFPPRMLLAATFETGISFITEVTDKARTVNKIKTCFFFIPHLLFN